MIRFISDLHLSSHEPEITARFLRFLKEKQSSTKALYILGDFFETWVGDDDRSRPIPVIQQALRLYVEQGIALYFIAGNRDFLLGKRFCEASGITLLKEPYVLLLNHTRTLLLHGDILCTDDKAYQFYRKIVHWPWLQKLFLCLPLRLRKNIAQKLRTKSRSRFNQKPFPYANVNEATLITLLEAKGATQVIHGHTHHLATHKHLLQNNISVTRFVLGDWKPNQGNVLSFDGEKLFFEYF